MARITSITGLSLALILALGSAGCGRKPGKDASLRDRIEKKLGDKVKDETKLTVAMTGNQFTVDDDKGNRLLEADVKKVDGQLTPGKGIEGAVKMLESKCRLFKNGKLEMTLDSPEATWDGVKLISEKSVHAVTAAKDKVIDAKRSVWTAKDNVLELEQAKLQSLAGKKLELTAEAPKAVVKDKIATMSQGVTGRTPDGDQMKATEMRWHFTPRRMEGAGGVTLTNPQGSRLTSNTMKWMLDTGKVEADGNVTLTEEGTTVTGQRLRADIKLKRGRLSGRPRVVMKRSLPSSLVSKKKDG